MWGTRLRNISQAHNITKDGLTNERLSFTTVALKSFRGETFVHFLCQIAAEVESFMEVTGHECTVEMESFEILRGSGWIVGLVKEIPPIRPPSLCCYPYGVGSGGTVESTAAGSVGLAHCSVP
jgi:hypothetical protein